MTPAPKRLGKPALTIAGSRIEPIATTVAGLEPDTAANSAQASTPASPGHRTSGRPSAWRRDHAPPRRRG
jgi:hypothetical protein